jgi:glycosyltransferase involved in cell wall biosynthesis
VETVCHVITKLELGGAQEVALYAVSHLDRTKFRPVLVAGPGGYLTEEARRIPGVQTIIISSLGRQIHAISDLLALFNLIRLFRRLRPAIVHTHSSKAGLLGRWAAWFARVPIIIHTVHGFGITPAQPAWLQRLLVRLERMAGWITTHWIVVAQVDARKGRQWGLFDSNVSVIRPGIDPRPFHLPMETATRDKIRLEFGAGLEDLLIGTVACLKPQKAPEDIVRVAHRLCEKLPHARFVLIGDGELRPRVEALIQQYGLHDRVRLAGWRRDIDRAMKSFDVLLHTSHWEGLPRVILEAATVGLPIVATRVGGVEEVVASGCNARLCEAGDIEGLAAELEGIVQGDEKGVRGKSVVRGELPEGFHIEEMVKQYQYLYDKLLSQQREKLMPNSPGPASQP